MLLQILLAKFWLVNLVVYASFIDLMFLIFSFVNFSDLFDPVVSPFKVPMDIVMGFIKNGFESGSESLQRQTLTWLQVLFCVVYFVSYFILGQ